MTARNPLVPVNLKKKSRGRSRERVDASEKAGAATEGGSGEIRFQKWNEVEQMKEDGSNVKSD